MKIGTTDNGTRDGALALVDTRSGMAAHVPEIAPSLQFAVDRWDEIEGPLRVAYDRLLKGDLSSAKRLNNLKWLAPLPRAYQILDGGGYRPHMELGYAMHKKPVPEDMAKTPAFYQSVSDCLLGPSDDLVLQGEDLGVDFEAELAVVVTDVGQGTGRGDAARSIRLVGLMNDISLRTVQRVEFARGFGFYHSKPKKAFAPFLATPDELGSHWKDFKLSLPARVEWNEKFFGSCDAAEGMMFDFATLVSEASRHRNLTAGTIIAGGTIASFDRATHGQCCIMERRVLDLMEFGEERTPYLAPGDRVRIEVMTPDGHTVFGAIDQILRRSESK